MIVELPDVNIGSRPLTSRQARLEIAVGLYVGREVTMGRAAQIADMSYATFMHELDRRGLCLNYTPEDALQDVETVRDRLGK
ncbi:MAG TPA: UPF0175 family protein [Verrucomicrobiae bacterium]